MKFKVYADENAPPNWGVQAIVYEDDDHGWVMVSQGDYYVQREGKFVQCDLSGLLDYVVNELGIVWVGRTVSNETFQRLYQEAKADRDFRRKTTYAPKERREPKP